MYSVKMRQHILDRISRSQVIDAMLQPQAEMGDEGLAVRTKFIEIVYIEDIGPVALKLKISVALWHHTKTDYGLTMLG